MVSSKTPLVGPHLEAARGACPERRDHWIDRHLWQPFDSAKACDTAMPRWLPETGQSRVPFTAGYSNAVRFVEFLSRCSGGYVGASQ